MRAYTSEKRKIGVALSRLLLSGDKTCKWTVCHLLTVPGEENFICRISKNYHIIIY